MSIILCIEISIYRLYSFEGILLDRKYTHSPANGIRYAAIRCFTKEPRRGDNYFTLFAILAFQRKKQVILNP